MCGRFVLATKPSAFIDRFRIAEQNKNSDQQLEFSERELSELEKQARELDHDFHEHFNIAPRGRVYAISRHETQDVELSKFRWGLIPPWAKDDKIGDKCFNARSETAHEKPSFRRAFKYSRCAVLADGYYEWKQIAPKQKQPFYIHNESSEPMFFAGLFEPKTQSATICTMEADGKMRELHHRRPVFLNEVEVTHWLDPEADKQDLIDVILSSSDSAIASYPVSTLVNRVGNVDDRTLIEPTQQLFDE